MNKVKRNGNTTKKMKGEFFVMKSFVDQDACIACGLCVSTCEDVYHFNEEGKAEAVEGIIPAGLPLKTARLWRLKLMKGELFSQLLP